MLLKSKNFQKLHRLHRLLGLILSVHVLILASTGVILVFKNELSPARPSTVEHGVPVTLQSLVDRGYQLYPNDRMLAIGVDDEDSQKVTLRLGKDGSEKFRGARRLTFDRRTGEPEIEAKTTGVLQSLLLLHRELFLGTYGKLYVGFLGLVYGFVLISGMLIYGPLMKRMNFGALRQHLQLRLFWADVHKYFGVMTFGWSLVVGLTGFLLGWGGPILKVYQGSALRGLTAEFAGAQDTRPFVSIDTALAAAEAAKPGSRFSFVAWPASEFSTAHHFIFVMEGTTPLTRKLSDLVVVNAHDGRLVKVLLLPIYMKILLLAEPLHFGDYGGLPMKVLWVLFGLSSMVLPLSGLRMFQQRLEKKANASMKVEQRTAAREKGPYTWPLILAILSWIGLGLALLLEGWQDSWANLMLALVLLISLWAYRRNKGSRTCER